MAVSTTNGFDGPYLANGATTSFPFTFTAPSAAEVAVLLRAADGTETVATGYTVTLGSESGGSVVFAAAPASGVKVIPFLDTEFTQQVEFEDGSPWLAAPVNEGYDRSAARDHVLKRDVARAILFPLDETAISLPSATERAGKFLAFNAGGNPYVAAGTGSDGSVREDLASPVAEFGVSLVAGALIAERPEDYGALDNGTDQTTALAACFAAARTKGTNRVDGGGKTYSVTGLAVTVDDLIVDNLTLKEFAPNSGDPVTVAFTAATAGTGNLVLGHGFKVDRSGDGTAGTLNVSCGVKVQSVQRVAAYCEIFGNAKGSGILVDSAQLFIDETHVHDMFCSHSGITDDIQHGSWARYCDNVRTGGWVHHLGNQDRTAVYRDRYNRGRAYSGCKNITLGGTVGPCVDQAYDVTGDANGGNSCVKMAGAHAEMPFSVGFKFANSVIAVAGGSCTAREPGLAGYFVSGPSTELLNMTSSAILTGLVQQGGGANGFWSNVSAVRLDRNDGNGEGQEYPKNVTVTGNVLAYNTGATTFTVLDTDELTPNLTNPLNIHKGARVRLTTTGTLPSGLATGTDYFATVTTSNTLKLSSSFNNCVDGVFISGFSGGSGTHTITVQNDVDWGVYCNVNAYDSAAPNLIYGNRFGGVPERSPDAQDLKASITRGTNQSITQNTNIYLTGSAKTDPYGIANLTAGTSSSTIVTAPLDGRYRISARGLWDSGAGAGTRQFGLQVDTGGGFADIAGYVNIAAYSTASETDALEWEGFLSKNTVIRVRLYQDEVSARDFTIREFMVEYLPQ